MTAKKDGNRMIKTINVSRLLLVVITFIIILFVYFCSDSFEDIPFNYIALVKIGVVSILYSLFLLLVDLHRYKIKYVGFLVSACDSLLIHFVVLYTGAAGSAFFLLFLFPLITLSLLYRTKGSTVLVLLFLLFSVYYIMIRDTSIFDLVAIFVKMALLVAFSVYLSNIGTIFRDEKKALQRKE